MSSCCQSSDNTSFDLDTWTGAGKVHACHVAQAVEGTLRIMTRGAPDGRVVSVLRRSRASHVVLTVADPRAHIETALRECNRTVESVVVVAPWHATYMCVPTVPHMPGEPRTRLVLEYTPRDHQRVAAARIVGADAARLIGNAAARLAGTASARDFRIELRATAPLLGSERVAMHRALHARVDAAGVRVAVAGVGEYCLM